MSLLLLALTACAPLPDGGAALDDSDDLRLGAEGPLAEAGPNRIGQLDDVYRFSGLSSEGEGLRWRWRLSDLPEGSALTDEDLLDADTPEPDFVPDVLGQFGLELEVCDAEGRCDTDVAWAWVVDPDAASGAPPLADAGGDQSVALGDSVSLDASGSSDPEGDALRYVWGFKSVPADSALVDSDISDRKTTSPSFTPDVEGTWKLRLRVTDETTWDLDIVIITVSDGTNSPPTADAGANQTVILGDTVDLDATGSTDPDGDALSYVWIFRTLPASSALTKADISARRTATPSFTPDVAGLYDVKVYAKDGIAKDADVVRITVATASNQPPVSDAGEDQTVKTGDAVALDGSGASDPDGDPLIYNWTFASVPSGSALVNSDISDRKSVSASFTPDVSGEYKVRLRVDDTGGEFDKHVSVVDAVDYTFDDDVQPILDAECARCHGGTSPSDGLDLETGAYGNLVDVASKDVSTMDRVEPYDSTNSYFMHKLDGTQSDVGGAGQQMPRGASALSSSDLELIRTWIDEGAWEAL